MPLTGKYSYCWKSIGTVDIGFAARESLKTSNLNESKNVEFLLEYIFFLSQMVVKLLQRSALHFSVVHNASCVSPILMADDFKLVKKKWNPIFKFIFKLNVQQLVFARR
jgi:hypothetical protein